MSNVVEYPLISLSITEALGERCPDFDPECWCCKAWAEFDALRAAISTEKERAEVAFRADLDARGLTIVPKVATEEQIEAGVNAREDLFEQMRQNGENTENILIAKHPAGTIYDAMVAVAARAFIKEAGE